MFTFQGTHHFLKKHPIFARLFWADFAAQVGQGMLVIAFPTLILEVTQDITLTGLSFTGEILAYGLISPWAGWLADRSDQKRLMQGSNLARFILLALLLGSLHQALPAWFYLLISVALGAAGAFFSPARAAFMRQVLSGEDLLEAVTLEGTTCFLVRMISPVVMGLLLLVSNARCGLIADASLYLVSMALLRPTWVKGSFKPEATQVDSAQDDWRDGWRLVLASPYLRPLLLVDLLVSFLGMATWSTVVAYLEQVIHRPAANNGWLQAAMGLTGALGARWASRLGQSKGIPWNLVALLGLSYLSISLTRDLSSLILVWSIRGFAVGALMVQISQTLARQVPSTHMGRVQAAWEQAVLLACFGGSIITPWLLRHGGPLKAFQIFGWLFLGGLGLLWLECLRKPSGLKVENLPRV